MILETTASVIIKDAEIDDLESFKYDGLEAEMLTSVNMRGQLGAYASVGRVYAVKEIGGEVTALYGDYETSKGVLQVWMLFNKSAAKYAKTIIKEMKIQLADRAAKFHRIQTFLFMGDKASKYLEILGFQKEATLKAFGPQREDAEVWARIS